MAIIWIKNTNINTEKRLWNSIVRNRFQLSVLNQMTIDCKFHIEEVRSKFKMDLRNYE